MPYYKCGKIFATQNSNTSIETASGAIANFRTSLAMPVLGCNAEFSASQASGTPTPSTPIPIVGVDKVNLTDCGKNLLSMKVYDGGSYNSAVGTQWTLTESTNQFTKSGNSYSITTSSTWRYFTVLMPIVSGVNYYLHLERASDGSDAISYTYLDKDFKVLANSNNTQTPYTTDSSLNPPANAAYYAMVFTNRSTANCTITITNPYVIVGSTATAYEAYNGTTVVINLGGTYYGGSVDCVTGKITLTHKLVSYTKNSTWAMNTSGVFYVSAPSGIDDLEMCNYFDVFLPRGSSSAIDDGQCRLNSNRTNINFKILSCETLEDFKTWLGDNTIQVVYSLATPIVVYASNTAELYTKAGLNNIFCDTGDIEVKYRRISNDL